MRNITNTSENVNNRNITNSINTNTLLATLPLELNNNGLDDVISIKGLSALGTGNQFLRMNNSGTELEFITLNLVDLNSTQTVLNKTLQNCSLNFNSNQHTNIGQNDKNVNINGFLNLNTGNDRAIISYNADDNHSIFLRRDIAGVDNRISFYEWDTINFYTGNALNISAPNMPLRLSINQTNIRLLVNTTVSGTFSATGLITGADATYTGALQSQSLITQMIDVFKDNNNGVIEIFKSSVDNGNNNGTAKLKFSTSIRTTGDGGGTVNTNIVEMGIFDNTTAFTLNNRENDITIKAETNINLKKNDDTPINLNFYKSTNYVSLVANNALNSNITVKLPTTGGTLAILGDIPEARLPIFIDTTNTGSDKITFKGLDGIGNANQIIQVNANGDGFVYGNLPSTFTLTANQPLTFSNNILSLGGLTNYGSNGQVITSTGSGLTYTTLSNLTNADVLFLVRTQAEDISTFSGNGLSGFPATDIGHTSRNVNINCDVFLLNFVGATATISNNSAQKLVISSTITKVKNLLLVSPSSTALEANAQLQVDTTAATKMVLKTTATDQDIELAYVNGNQSGFLKMIASDNSFNFNNFPIYNFRVGATRRLYFDTDYTSNFNTYSFDIAGTQALGIDSADFYSSVSNSYQFNIGTNEVFRLTGTKIRHPIETETNKQMYFYKIDTTTFDNANFRGKIFTGNDSDFAFISNNIHLRLHAGEVVGQVSGITGANVAIQFYINGSERAYITKTLFIVNNFFQVNYNNVNSFTQLTSNVANPKVGLHLINSGTNAFLYFNFSSLNLVYESPAGDATGQRFQINGQAPSIIDGNGRGMIFRTNTGNFHGLQVGNATDKLSLNFGSAGSVFTDSNGNLFSETFTSHSWKISAGNLAWQSDRNLVIYDSNNSAIFASNTSTSDRDKKENIVELEQNESIDIVKQLKTYRYNYIDDTEKTPQIGFMADETKQLIPECIKTITNGDKVSNLLFKENTIPHLVNTIQSLLSKVELLESRISQLESSSS